MKLILATLLLASTSQAFAYGAQEMFFDCTSAHAKIHVDIEASEADGVDVNEVKFQGQTIVSEVKQNTPEMSTKAPTRLDFKWRSHNVSIRTAKDVIETSLNGGAAILTIDGKREFMKCTP